MASSVVNNNSPSRLGKNMNSQPRKRNHPFITSGLFDIISKIDTELPGNYGPRETMTTIPTINVDTGEILECAIKASGYGGPDDVLTEGNMYILKGRLVALNEKKLQGFYYENETAIHVSPSDSFRSSLTNKVAVSGLGLIVSREVEKVTAEKENVTIIVRHNDYNPAPSSREHQTFDVEYKCNWSPLMVKLQPLLVPNREALLTGRIIGFSPSQNMWSVEITGVNISSGHETPSSSTFPSAGTTLGTPGGRTRGKLFIPGDPEPEITQDPIQSSVKPRGRAQASSPTSRQNNKKARGNTSAEDSLIDPA
ncbi:hypothetical protein DFH28DRAFT_1083278 [Melampsora americana]|nr:hypothetical protein DFH28DRAFT_1139097 [Melampsora americana]KAH9813835.1 hypothetical protein DFH28DRAFT_1083278 [Melampsora americana]